LRNRQKYGSINDVLEISEITHKALILDEYKKSMPINAIMYSNEWNKDTANTNIL
jgi:hypothetical protein